MVFFMLGSADVCDIHVHTTKHMVGAWRTMDEFRCNVLAAILPHSPACHGCCVAHQHEAVGQHAAHTNDLDNQHSQAVPAVTARRTAVRLTAPHRTCLHLVPAQPCMPMFKAVVRTRHADSLI
jgi:hypothetical protein